MREMTGFRSDETEKEKERETDRQRQMNKDDYIKAMLYQRY